MNTDILMIGLVVGTVITCFATYLCASGQHVSKLAYCGAKCLCCWTALASPQSVHYWWFPVPQRLFITHRNYSLH